MRSRSDRCAGWDGHDREGEVCVGVKISTCVYDGPTGLLGRWMKESALRKRAEGKGGSLD